MRRTRRVAKVARKAGAGQAQTAWSGFRSGTVASGNPQKTLLGQPRQARQGDSDHPYMREANQCACEPEPELVNHTNNSISHVSFSCEADQADQADQAKESAAFSHSAQADLSLTEPSSLPDHDESEFVAWLKGEPYTRPGERVAWTERPDVVTVVGDVAGEGWRPGRIARTLGLSRVEVVTIQRRTGR